MQVLRVMQPHLRAVNCLALDSLGRLWTGAEDRTIRVVDPVVCCTPFLLAHLLVSVLISHRLQLGKVMTTAGSHTSYVTALEAADGVVFSGSDDCTVRVWDEKVWRGPASFFFPLVRC
jgi:WD40 repeat protein